MKIANEEQYKDAKKLIDLNQNNPSYRFLSFVKSVELSPSDLKDYVLEDKYNWEEMFPDLYQKYKSGDITLDEFCEVLRNTAMSKRNVLTSLQINLLKDSLMYYDHEKLKASTPMNPPPSEKNRKPSTRKSSKSSKSSTHKLNRSLTYSADIEPSTRKLTKSSTGSFDIEPSTRKLTKSSTGLFDIQPLARKLTKSTTNSINIQPSPRYH